MWRTIIWAFFISTTASYNVIFFHNIGTKSHLIQMSALIEELLQRGHDVTGIFFGSLEIDHANYTEIIIQDYFDDIQKEVSKKVMEEGGQSPFNMRLWFWTFKTWQNSIEDLSVGCYKEEKFKHFLDSDQKVDAVVTYYPMGAFLSDHFDCPIINFSPIGPVFFLLYGSGNIINPSVQPIIIGPFIEPMSFSQRIQNHVLTAASDLFISWVLQSQTSYQRKLLGPDIRHPYDIIQQRSSVFLSCSHFVTHGSWPYLPNVIEVGGIHLKGPKDLPEDLKLFMDSSKNGVAFVSFGSSLSPSKMSKEKLDIFVEAFSVVEMAIIWKWDADVPNLPPNVKINPWLPQQDLLGHPNLKLFVTHGGLGSLVEAIYNNVVVLGIPLSNDQRPNLLRAVRHGYASMIEWDSLTAEDLVKNIKEAVTDDTMRVFMERIHNLYMDRQAKPVETAAWWVEYVSRHQGAEMLKSEAEDILWYQYNHLDIIIFLLVVFFFFIGGMVLSCMFCCRIFCCRIFCSKKYKVD